MDPSIETTEASPKDGHLREAESAGEQAETGHPLPPKVVTRGVRAIDQMRRLIDDLLDVARIDSGTLVVARAPLEVAALVRDAAEQHVALAGEKGLSLSVECVEGLHIDGDRDRLMQLVGNLIGNAIKFTPAGGRIVLGCARRHDAIHVSVTDSGPGVPTDSRAHVFDRFYQSSRRKDGVGLGLAIAKGIVDAHGGRIGVEGAEPAGARFWFDLPARGAPRYVGGAPS